MLELAVVGKSEFTMGFRLAGIKKVYDTEKDAEKVINHMMDKKEVGVVILDKEAFDTLDEFGKQKVEDAINPVFVVLSEEESDNNLRRMIKKSIGVDVWGK